MKRRRPKTRRSRHLPRPARCKCPPLDVLRRRHREAMTAVERGSRRIEQVSAPTVHVKFAACSRAEVKQLDGKQRGNLRRNPSRQKEARGYLSVTLGRISRPGMLCFVKASERRRLERTIRCSVSDVNPISRLPSSPSRVVANPACLTSVCSGCSEVEATPGTPTFCAARCGQNEVSSTARNGGGLGMLPFARFRICINNYLVPSS